MEPTSEIPQQQETPAVGRTLQVDFAWKKWKILVIDKEDKGSKPLYKVDCSRFLAPHLVFRSGTHDSKIGTGSLHAVSINADCELRGQAIELQALKRLHTSYMHLSHNFSDSDEPVAMTWTSATDFKTWDFICLDPQQMPVAKFSANIWALKKIGNIEFLGEKTASEAAREEIVVTGLTLFYCMILRCNNVLSLFGAMIAKPPKVGNDTQLKAIPVESSTVTTLADKKAV